VSKQVGDFYCTEPGSYREHYVRDAQGNIMATYRYRNTTAEGLSLKLNERPMYGSSRLGSLRTEVELRSLPSFDPTSANPVQQVDLNYELTDHLGNVCAVVTGRLLDGNGGGTPKQAELVSAQGYEAFGSLLPGRNYSSGSYRFGFQGQEKDNEIYGVEGTALSFTYRVHDTRVGRFLSIDPLASKYPHNSPYAFSENRVIDAVELEGLESQIISRLQTDNGRTIVLKVQSWKDIKGNTGNHGPKGKGVEYHDFRLGADYADISYEPTTMERLSSWWDSFSIGDQTGGNRGDVEYTDQKPGQVLSPDEFGPTKGNNPQVSTDDSRKGESNATESKPSWFDRHWGVDFKEVQEGDTFWMPVKDPAGGTYPMTYRKDSTSATGFGYETARCPENKGARDYKKVKPGTAP
jgi:RHS repeat-associated protein